MFMSCHNGGMKHFIEIVVSFAPKDLKIAIGRFVQVSTSVFLILIGIYKIVLSVNLLAE